MNGTSAFRMAMIGGLILVAAASPSVTAEPPVVLHDPEAVNQLLVNLRGDDVTAASAAARSLGVVFAPGGKGQAAQVDQVVKALIEQLSASRGAAVRREAATALGLVEARSAVAALTERMADSEITVAVAAGIALGKILPVDEARTLFVKKIDPAAENITAASLAGLAPLSKAEDAKLLVDALSAKNWRVQMYAVRGLEKAVLAGARIDGRDYDLAAAVLGAQTSEAAETAEHFLTHVRNEECLRAAIAAADARGDGSRDDVSWRTRTYALRTLRHLDWPATKAALPVVVRNLGDPTANVVNEARAFLSLLRKEHLLSRDELFPVLAGELEKGGPLPRRAAILTEMGDDVPREHASTVAAAAAKTLEESLTNSDNWTARSAAVKVLGLCESTTSLESIARCIGDDVSNVRFAAGKSLEQLARLASAEEKARVAKLLLPHLTATSDWRKTAVAAHAAGDYAQKETVQPLVDLLGHSVINVKEGAAHSLCKIARGDDAQLRAILEKSVQAEFAEGEKCWEYGTMVVGALRDPKDLGLLIPVLAASNWRAQAHAAAAVTEIATHSRSKIDNKPLAEALIKAAQSEILQVQEEANRALRALARGE